MKKEILATYEIHVYGYDGVVDVYKCVVTNGASKKCRKYSYYGN